MTKKVKKLLLTLSVMSMLTAGVALGGCQPKVEGPGPRFLKGIDKEIDLGDGIDVGDYIVYVTDSEYTITVTKEGYSADITKKRYWQPDEPGVYTITYTVEEGEFAGTNSFELKVSAPKMMWKYTLINKIFDTGDVMQFEDYFNDMNISAQSYYPWEMVMDSVTLGDETIDLTQATSWTFTEAEQHVFKFHIEATDGQSYSLSQAINVRYVDQEMLTWMDDNDVTVDRALRLEKSGKVVLDAGTHGGDNVTSPDNAKNHSLPHLDFNGEYGVNDFVVLDFTGNNMPAMLFFGEEITDTPYYKDDATAAQNKGILVANGWTTKKGIPVTAWQTETHMNGRLTVYGPTKTLKMSDTKQGFFRENFSVRPNPASVYTLSQEENANRKFRMFAGITAASAESFTYTIYLMDRVTGAAVYEDSITIANTRIVVGTKVENGQTKYVFNDGTISFADDIFTGSIALYSMFGRSITFDKVYAIEEDTTVAALKLKYLESQYQWMKDNVITTYGVTYADDDQKVVLMGSKHNGNQTQGPDYVRGRDMSYIAFNGDYGLNDFLVFDFTGNNMPILSFFNDQVTNTVYNCDTNDINTNYAYNAENASKNKGIILSNGWTTITGDPIASYNKANGVNDRYQVFGPIKMFKSGSDNENFFRKNVIGNGAPIGMYTLQQNPDTKYRAIVGFTTGDTTGFKVAIYVINRDTGAVVCDVETAISFTMPANYYTGSIALYSHFGMEITLDKLYLIEQDTTMSALKTKYAVNA